MRNSALDLAPGLALALICSIAPTTPSLAQTKAAAPAPAYAAFAKGRIDVDGGVIRVAAQREGLLMNIAADDGAEVRKGAVLASQDDRQVRLQLESARQELREIDARANPLRVRLATAERELARIAPLGANQAIARAEIDAQRDQVALLKAEIASAEAQAGVGQARVRQAALEVELRTLRAPVDGRIVKRFLRAGDSAPAGAPLFLLAPKGPRVARTDLEERFVHLVKPGMAAEVVVEADANRVYKGRVLRLGQAFGVRPPSDDPTERADVRSVEMIVALEGEVALLIGQRVMVRLPAAKP